MILPFNGGRPPANSILRHAFFAPLTLAFNSLTLMYELDLDILKMYYHARNKLLSGSRLLKVRASQTDRDTQTDETENMTTPHWRLKVKTDAHKYTQHE